MEILLNKTEGNYKETQFEIKLINTVNINAFSISRAVPTDSNCSCELSAVLKITFPKLSLQKMMET